MFEDEGMRENAGTGETLEAFARPIEPVTMLPVSSASEPALFEDSRSSGLTRSLARGEISSIMRMATEAADRIERDAQEFVRKQVTKLQQEVRDARLELARDRDEVDRMRDEVDRERLDIITAARGESARILSEAQSRADGKIREAETSGAQIVAAAQLRADEIGRTAMMEARELREWAQGQGKEIIERAQAGAEMLLQAAGRGQLAVDTVTEIVSQAMRTPAAGPEQRL